MFHDLLMGNKGFLIGHGDAATLLGVLGVDLPDLEETQSLLHLAHHRVALRLVSHADVYRPHGTTVDAEVNAIRVACDRLHTFDLSGCEIYCSCEPCPMCLGAIYWARLDHIYYANNRKAAASIGFDDDLIYQEIGRAMADRQKPIEELLPEEGRKAFDLWRSTINKTTY